MKIKDSLKYSGLAGLVLTVAAGCATVQQEPRGPEAEARQAIEQAREAANVAAQEGQVWRDTEKFIADAEKALEAGDAQQALELAERARKEAEMAADQRRTERQAFRRAAAENAIQDAEAALNDARAAGQEWRDTEKMIDDARKAFDAGDYDTAYELAIQARRQAMMAADQRRTEADSFRGAAAGGEATEYNVQRGDSLWSISGKAEVYNNPYHWPLIYRTNRDQITDADLIYPGQRFRIERNFSQQDVDAAAQHARTRGEWELGRVEQSDQDYLRGRR